MKGESTEGSKSTSEKEQLSGARLIERKGNDTAMMVGLRVGAPFLILLHGSTSDRAKTKEGTVSRSLFPVPALAVLSQPAAFTMSKIGRYIATTMPPTTTPRNTIMTGSISDSRPDTAASTSSS
jgi:hypothetical protein